jgi:hypothetical protein
MPALAIAGDSGSAGWQGICRREAPLLAKDARNGAWVINFAQTPGLLAMKIVMLIGRALSGPVAPAFVFPMKP